MEFGQRASIVGANMENMGKVPPPQRHIITDIVLINRTEDSLKPTLYLIKNDALPSEDDFLTLKKNGYYSIDRNAFMMAGDVLSMDKKRKHISLSSGDTVSYNHLILASGIYPPPSGSAQDEEFIAGLYALLEALKVRKNLPEYLRSPEIHELTLKYRLPIKLSLIEEDEAQSTMIKLMHPKMSLKIPNDSKKISNIGDKRLYEVVL